MPLKKTTIMRLLEARYLGQDIRQIVQAVTSRNPTPEAAAAELGISKQCLDNWQRLFARTDAEDRQPAEVA
jgi:hypothetical protein